METTEKRVSKMTAQEWTARRLAWLFSRADAEVRDCKFESTSQIKNNVESLFKAHVTLEVLRGVNLAMENETFVQVAERFIQKVTERLLCGDFRIMSSNAMDTLCTVWEWERMGELAREFQQLIENEKSEKN